MYVPVYGTMYDGVSGVNTHSRRGRITSIHGNVNTHFGSALDFNVMSSGEFKKKDIKHVETMFQYWKLKGNKRWMNHYSERLKRDLEHNRKLRDQEYVHVAVNFNHTINNLKINIDGVELDEQLSNLLYWVSLRQWDEVVKLMREMNDGNCIFESAVIQKI